MNGYFLSAGILAIVAFFVHAMIGDKEYRQLRPAAEGGDAKLMEAWIQARSGWHWVSVDLLLTGLVLIVLASTRFLSAVKEIAYLLVIYYLAAGLVWLITVFLSKTHGRQVFSMGQWIFCFVMSGLVYRGAAVL